MIKRLLILCLALCLVLPSARALEGEMAFHFLQVEQMRDDSIGDCTLIQLPNGQTMLVDAMMPECGPYIVEYLRAQGVTRLDYVLATHMHIDHIGGLADVMDQFDVGMLLSPGVPYSTETYEAYAARIRAHGIEERVLRRGDEMALGGATLTVLNPEIDDALYQKFVRDELTVAQTNQYSIVFMLQYKDFKALFTGDIYQDAEKELVNLYGDALACDLMKIPHHGDSSSAYKKFIEAAHAAYAVAMGNTAMEEWLYKRYQKAGTTVYLTLLDGTVVVRTDGERVDAAAQWVRNAPRYPLGAEAAAQ